MAAKLLAIWTIRRNPMHPWGCLAAICVAGAFGGLANAVVNDNGFALPRKIKGVWCPGAVGTVVLGAFAAFASWAFYGSGAGIDVTDTASVIHLQFSAIAGAFLVGVVGTKWITDQAGNQILRKSVGKAAEDVLPKDKMAAIAFESPAGVFDLVTAACEKRRPKESAASV